MQYIKLIDNLSLLLNTKNHNRGKKGFKIREEFKGYLKILKDDFEKDISTEFLFNLMSQNYTLNNRQKRKKIQNLILGLDKEKRSFYIRGLEVLNYHTDITEYGLNKKDFVYTQKCELLQEEQEQIKEIEQIKNNCGIELVKRAENDFNERQRRQNAFNGHKVFIKNVRTEHIAKEFITSHRKNFNFIIA